MLSYYISQYNYSFKTQTNRKVRQTATEKPRRESSNSNESKKKKRKTSKQNSSWERREVGYIRKVDGKQNPLPTWQMFHKSKDTETFCYRIIMVTLTTQTQRQPSRYNPCNPPTQDQQYQSSSKRTYLSGVMPRSCWVDMLLGIGHLEFANKLQPKKKKEREKKKKFCVFMITFPEKLGSSQSKEVSILLFSTRGVNLLLLLTTKLQTEELTILFQTFKMDKKSAFPQKSS